METGSGDSIPAKRPAVDAEDSKVDLKPAPSTDPSKTPSKSLNKAEKQALLEAKKAKLLEKQRQKAEKNKQKAEKKKGSSSEDSDSPPTREAEVLKTEKLPEEEDEDYSPSENDSDESEVSLLSEERNHGDMEDFDLEAYKRFLAAEKEESDS